MAGEEPADAGCGEVRDEHEGYVEVWRLVGDAVAVHPSRDREAHHEVEKVEPYGKAEGSDGADGPSSPD